MKKLKLIIEILVGLNTLFLIISKYIKDYNIFSWLFDIKISINMLHILLILLVIILAFLYNSKNLTKLNYKYRAKRFYRNWIKLKNILIEFKESKNVGLQNDYNKTAEKLKSDYHFFNDKIYEIQKSLGKEYINMVLDNFEQCFSIREIKNWQDKVGRNIPEELDCFDYLVIEIKEYYNK